MAIAATIRAAEIQASATKIAAVYGGLALGAGVFASWLTSLHLQKVARLAETRRDVYLELVASYSNMINGFFILPSDVGNRWHEQEKLVLKFSHSMDKAIFICDTSTKEQLFEFILFFQEKYKSIHDEIMPIMIEIGKLNLLKENHIKIMQGFDFSVSEIEKMQIEGIDEIKIGNTLNFMKDKLAKGEDIQKKLESQNESIWEMIEPLTTNIVSMMEELNTSAVPIVRSLRKELGAKTDIQLEDKIIQKYKDK